MPYAYSSEEDFADGNNNDDYTRSPMMPGKHKINRWNETWYGKFGIFADYSSTIGNMPGYFPVGRDWGGRIEMP